MTIIQILYNVSPAFEFAVSAKITKVVRCVLAFKMQQKAVFYLAVHVRKDSLTTKSTKLVKGNDNLLLLLTKQNQVVQSIAQHVNLIMPASLAVV